MISQVLTGRHRNGRNPGHAKPVTGTRYPSARQSTPVSFCVMGPRPGSTRAVRGGETASLSQNIPLSTQAVTCTFAAAGFCSSTSEGSRP
jgi:hypothetical protein